MNPRPADVDAGPATIYTVAERAGVSHQTVARFIRGEKLRPANHERVQQAIDELGYRSNDAARELATRRSRRIGALVFDVDDWAPQRVLAGASEAAVQAGYVLEVIRVDMSSGESIARAAGVLESVSLAGVVVLAPPEFVNRQLDLDMLRIPWLIEAEPPLPDDRAVFERHPVALAVRHLAELGHERFFHLGGPQEWPSGRNRAAVFHRTVAELGLQDCGATTGLWGPSTGYWAMDECPVDLAPTALVAASDQIALGALAWMHERGIDVPGEVSITGYDGLRDAAFYSPPLTTLQIDFESMGRRAINALLEGRGLHQLPGVAEYPFEAKLVVRSSTSAPGPGITRR